MVETLVSGFTTLFADRLPEEIIVFLLSMLPILELRGGLIAAALYDIPILEAVCICFIGNLLPIPFLLWLIRPVFSWLRKTSLFQPFVDRLEKNAVGKSNTIQRCQFWGLLIFVGIPLPGTGAWTGALIASLLNIRIKRAMPPIILGLGMATGIMCFVSYLLPWLIMQLAQVGVH